MSKVPYTIDVNRYICTELESIRTMLKTFDFSPLPAIIERIQHHASSMEDALYNGKDKVYTAVRDLKKIEEKQKDKKLKKDLNKIIKELEE